MKKFEIIGLVLAVLIILATYTINNSYRIIRAVTLPSHMLAAIDESARTNNRRSQGGPLAVATSKPAYYRYELVDIIADFRDLDNETIMAGSVTAKFYFNNSLVETVGGLKTITLQFDKNSGMWVGRWPIPWNPPLGNYEVLITAKPDYPGPAHIARTRFIVQGRAIPPVQEGFCAVLLEDNFSLVNRNTIPGPDGSTGSIEKIIEWAKYMGADAFFNLVAITHGPGYNSVTRPFDEQKFETAEQFARLCVDNDIYYGGWAQSYFSQERGFDELGYHASVGLSDRGNLYESYHISLTDEKRRRDLTDFARRMNEDRNVSFIGFDYIRTGHADGYEMVDEFVADMNIALPPQWDGYTKPDRILWLGRQLENQKNKNIIERWRWWRAHTSAGLIAQIIRESGTQKPVWVFTLGWEHGRQHGQDPLMFFDAGVFYDSVMLYEANQAQFKNLLVHWKNYLNHNDVNMLCGNSVDVELLDSYYLSPPEELVRRNITGVQQLLHGGLADGLFWHDFMRALRGRKGEFSMKEWCISGGKSFTDYRIKIGTMPISTRLVTPQNAGYNRNFTATVTVENISINDLKNVVVSIEETQGVLCVSDRSITIETLHAGESQTIEYTLRLTDASRTMGMPTTLVTWAGDGRHFNFEIVRRGGNVSTRQTSENQTI